MSFRDWIADVLSGGRLTAYKRHNAFLADLLRTYERENEELLRAQQAGRE